MSRGNDERDAHERGNRSGSGHGLASSRSSKTSIRMTLERARAIQAHADHTCASPDFKARAMSAAARNDPGDSRNDE